MVGQTVADNWLVTIWKSSRKSISREPEKAVLGIMAFEVSKLMSKVVSLWQSLTDRELVRLREEIASSAGIRKLVSDSEDHLMDLVFAEIIENLKSVCRSVILLGKRCTDPRYHDLDRVLDERGELDPDWFGSRFRLKKMEKNVKKMEKFAAATEQLYQELEVLAELEQSLRRMRAGPDIRVLEFQKKVMWQRQEVKNLKEMSPWIKTYDYTVQLLLRSIFTIVERLTCVYSGTKQNGGHLSRSNSLRQTSVYPSETNIFSYSFPLGRSFSSLGLGGQKTQSKNVKLKSKSHSRSRSSVFISGKQQPSMRGRISFAPAGFTGCMEKKMCESPVVVESSFGSANDASSRKDPIKLKDILYGGGKSVKKASLATNTKSRPLNFPPSTLGHAALAVRYANIIILIEKLASSPELVSLDARDDLYSMLPTAVKSCLRAKLRAFSRGSGCDAAFAAEWGQAVGRILEWLSPLAHGTVRWQSERNFERQRFSLGPNVRLVQTLYFADRAETEAVIVELLVGLNYLCRFGREMNRKT
ncbi:Protein of unknown function (DUF668 [Striga hermonthica]|uniref:Uncharacterized protein n=1 Tax=Striga hermonthica TaxID=68872 RepID=A0A9N7RIV6_STRHE|nr:Protein of unknown function (DUF668 [Striga hermonthica]